MRRQISGWQPSWLTWRNRGAALFVAVAVFTVGAVYEDIVQGVAEWIWDALPRLLLESSWWFGFITGVALTALMLSIVFGRRFRRLRTSRDIVVKLTELDDTLVRAIPHMLYANDRPLRVRKLLEETLSDCAHIFGEHVLRGAIFQVEGDYLTPWVSYQMAQATMQHARFYIGADQEKRRGIAGEAYRHRQVRLVHMIYENGCWRPDDNNNYIDFDFDQGRARPPYSSFIVVPLTWNRERLGVMTLDSTSSTVFDSQDIQDLLVSVGARVAVVILLYNLLEGKLGPLRARSPRP